MRWLPYRDQYLDEMLRADGFGDYTGDCCSKCESLDSLYRCQDCGAASLRCRSCVLADHKYLPLHRIQVFYSSNIVHFAWLIYCQTWTGVYFQRDTLSRIGLVVQLGHGGAECPCPSVSCSSLTVVDLSGIHEVSVRYCACMKSDNSTLEHWRQLFRHGWFPGTTICPRTAFTFHLLDLFLELNWRAKTNLHDFYNTIENLTDKTGVGGGHVSPFTHFVMYSTDIYHSIVTVNSRWPSVYGGIYFSSNGLEEATILRDLRELHRAGWSLNAPRVLNRAVIFQRIGRSVRQL